MCSGPVASMSTSARSRSPLSVWMLQPPSSKQALATVSPKAMCGSRPYFSATASKYSRISGPGEKRCVQSSLASKLYE